MLCQISLDRICLNFKLSSERYNGMKRVILLVITIVSCVPLLFFIFLEAAYAHSSVAPHLNITPKQSAKASGNAAAKKVSSCGWHNIGEQDTTMMGVILWEYTCDGGVHAQLVAHASGNFEVDLYEDGHFLTYSSGYLSPGQYLITDTYHGYSSYDAYGYYS